MELDETRTRMLLNWFENYSHSPMAVIWLMQHLDYLKAKE